MKGLASFLSIIGFYLGYWMFKSIFHSFLDETTKLDFIIRGEWIIAGLLSAIICAINSKEEDKIQLTTMCIIGFLTIIALFLPFSMGFVVFYNLAILGCIMYSIWGH